jgi:hypothetical protein
MLLPLAFVGLSWSNKQTLTTTCVFSALALSLFVYVLANTFCYFAVLMRDRHNLRMEQHSSTFTVSFFLEYVHRPNVKKNTTLKKWGESYAIVKAPQHWILLPCSLCLSNPESWWLPCIILRYTFRSHRTMFRHEVAPITRTWWTFHWTVLASGKLDFPWSQFPKMYTNILSLPHLF